MIIDKRKNYEAVKASEKLRKEREEKVDERLVDAATFDKHFLHNTDNGVKPLSGVEYRKFELTMNDKKIDFSPLDQKGANIANLNLNYCAVFGITHTKFSISFKVRESFFQSITAENLHGYKLFKLLWQARI